MYINNYCIFIYLVTSQEGNNFFQTTRANFYNVCANGAWILNYKITEYQQLSARYTREVDNGLVTSDLFIVNNKWI